MAIRLFCTSEILCSALLGFGEVLSCILMLGRGYYHQIATLFRSAAWSGSMPAISRFLLLKPGVLSLRPGVSTLVISPLLQALDLAYMNAKNGRKLSCRLAAGWPPVRLALPCTLDCCWAESHEACRVRSTPTLRHAGFQNKRSPGTRQARQDPSTLLPYYVCPASPHRQAAIRLFCATARIAQAILNLNRRRLLSQKKGHHPGQ